MLTPAIMLNSSPAMWPVLPRHADPARIGLGVGDEFRNRFDRNRWIDLHHERDADEACDRRNIVDEIEVEFLVERCTDGVCPGGDEERIAARGCTHDRLGADVASRPRPVLDDKLLPQPP